MRKRGRTDDNQKKIVTALRQMGCDVLSLSAVGQGCPDLLVHKRKRLVLLEVKDGDKKPSARKLTPDQTEFHERWPVFVVNSVDEAIKLVEMYL